MLLFVLNLFQNVRVVDVILDGVGDWIVPGHTVVIEYRPPPPLYSLLLDLAHHLVPMPQFLLDQPALYFLTNELLVLLALP